MPDDHSYLVYSTEKTVSRDKNSKKKNKVEVQDNSGPSALSYAKVIVRLDRKGRGGKSVTVLEGLSLSGTETDTFLRQLKSKMGAGGTVKGGSLEIQGDHCDKLIAVLEKMGLKPRRSGQ